MTCFAMDAGKVGRLKVDLAVIGDALSLSEPIQADIPSSPVPHLPIEQIDSGQRQNGLRRLGKLFQRIDLG